MRCQRGQATVEWTGLVLLVAAALTAAGMAAHALGTVGLPERLACAVAGGDCAPRRVFSAADFRPLVGRTAKVGTRETGSSALLATVVPEATILEDGGGFIWRHRHVVRKVMVATAIAGGVAATCTAAVAAANVIGAVGCGSAVVIGGFAEYDNARR